jgi:hypothetical protein
VPQANEDKRPKRASDERGVFSNLPSTRPQRPSARRAAAKSGGTTGAATKGAAPSERSKPTKPGAPTKRTATTGDRTNPPRRASKHADPAARTRGGARRATEEPSIPRQGFATEEEIPPGSTVQPPSRPELAAAVAELLGELAQGSLTAGGRLLKDILGRLPGA